jgi:hypothetical protein
MYRFEPGSYQTPAGFLPAIACYKSKGDSEVLDYILVNTNIIIKTEDSAVQKSTELLNKAFKYRQGTGDDIKVAESLRLDGFKVFDDPMFAK